MKTTETLTRRERRKANKPPNNGCKYKCYTCNQPFTLSTAMNESKFCSLRCEPK